MLSYTGHLHFFRHALMTTETKAFGALVIFIGAIVVAAVGYDMYLHPASPQVMDEALVKITGTSAFHGKVGTVENASEIDGKAPFTMTVPYRLSDYVTADIDFASSPGTVKIRVACRTVKETTASGRLLIWKVPPSWQIGESPRKLLGCKT